MMTYEELKKAHEEGTWLLWTPSWRSPQLVFPRVADMNVQANQFLSDLRIATPNDMLKYGD